MNYKQIFVKNDFLEVDEDLYIINPTLDYRMVIGQMKVIDNEYHIVIKDKQFLIDKMYLLALVDLLDHMNWRHPLKKEIK